MRETEKLGSLLNSSSPQLSTFVAAHLVVSVDMRTTPPGSPTPSPHFRQGGDPINVNSAPGSSLWGRGVGPWWFLVCYRTVWWGFLVWGVADASAVRWRTTIIGL